MLKFYVKSHDGDCDTKDCGSRATMDLVDNRESQPRVISKHCTKHAPQALRAVETLAESQ